MCLCVHVFYNNNGTFNYTSIRSKNVFNLNYFRNLTIFEITIKYARSFYLCGH